MGTFFGRLATIAILIASFACGSKEESTNDEPPSARTTDVDEPAAQAAPEPPANAEPTSVEMDEVAAFFRTLADTAVTNKGDCGKAVSALEDVVSAHRPQIERVKRYRKDPVARKAWDQAHGGVIKEQMMRFLGALQSCKNDPGLQAVMSKLD